MEHAIPATESLSAKPICVGLIPVTIRFESL